LGIQEVDDRAGGMTIYPNPFTDNTTIRFSNPDQSRFRIHITDLAGKVVYLEDDIYTDQIEFNRNDLPAGVYFVEMRGSAVYRGRLVVE